jgi:hypothetical protein
MSSMTEEQLEATLAANNAVVPSCLYPGSSSTRTPLNFNTKSDQAIHKAAVMRTGPATTAKARRAKEAKAEQSRAFVKKMRALPLPTDGKPRSKKLDGETIHFCSKHNAWGAHQESNCKKGFAGASASPSAGSSSESPKRKKKREEAREKAHLQITQALAAVLDNYDSDSTADSSSEEE